ncbi:MAG TPA: GNAT family N-acetyltransferase [Candidatus Sulfomarinibacteraceae bacterium]|nr:GNAT family N-acetyltransferase [Candidatus Sulfomarinibacteraceae bacterium]
MHVELIEGAEVFSTLGEEWDSLVARAMTNTPFQQLAYQQSWWNHLGPGDLHTIVVRDSKGGGLCAVACFYLYEGTLYFNGCVEETDYLDLIVPTSDAEWAWQTVFDTLEGPNFPPWERLNLCNVPDVSPTRTILAQIASQRGYQFNVSVQDVCPVLSLPETFDDYLMALDKKQRHEIRRKRRRARAASAELAMVGPDDNVHKEVDVFLELLQMSTTEKEDWLNEGRRAVFHEVGEAALAAGSLQLLFLELRGEKIAGLFNFDYDGRIWVYNSGLNIAQFGRLSPGVVLTADAIEMAIETGRKEFDFLRGDEQYKYRFGAEDTTIHRVQMSRS